MKTTPEITGLVEPFTFGSAPYEYRITPLRECPAPDQMQICDDPDKADAYWRAHITKHPFYNPDVECLVVLLLNTRRKLKGHHLVSTGTMDTVLVHPREIFRVAIMTASSSILVMHNHPSGESNPSEADIKVTRDMIRAGQILKIEVVDHIIIGHSTRSSLKELGYFHSF